MRTLGKSTFRRATAVAAALVSLNIASAAGVAAKSPAAKSPKTHKAAKPAAKKATVTKFPSAAVAQSFDTFCKEWMAKLAARQSDNLKQIKWEKSGDGVAGTYVGYSQEHTCTLTEGTGHVPVGHVQYQEVRYKKQGATESDAEHSTPLAIEIFEATELFSYAKGKWVY